MHNETKTNIETPQTMWGNETMNQQQQNGQQPKPLLICLYMQVSMIRKYYNHPLQANPIYTASP